MSHTENRLPLIGEAAPAFHAVTTNGEVHFPEDYKGKWVILFSHPADFTPVCTTEFMTFAKMQEEFKAMNCELIGLSIDSLHSHIAWLRSIEQLSWKDMDKVQVQFPLIADIKMQVANQYGMLQGESDVHAVRAVFIIDDKGIIRTILYYPASTGRNMTEIKRILTSLQRVDANHIATPADWQPGDDVIIPPPTCMVEAEARVSQAPADHKPLEWFLSFRGDQG